MRAVLLDGYGGPEKLRVGDAPDAPDPGRGQVRVRIHAASVNPIDVKLCAGYFRLIPGQRMPMIPGSDCSGVVDAVGPGVNTLKEGDAVFGMVTGGCGHTFAQAVTAPAKRFVHKPDNVTHAQAASTVLVGVTALEALNRIATISAGQRVFVSAGAGGVGSFAVQYAAGTGAQVLASASPANADFVRALGADTVYDYAQADLPSVLRDLDVVFDAFGDMDASAWLSSLKPGGVFITTGSGGRGMEELARRFGKRWWLMGGLMDVMRLNLRARRQQRRRVAMVFGQPRPAHLAHLARLLADGTIKAQVGQVYALEETPQAFADAQSGHARGKRVIQVVA